MQKIQRALHSLKMYQAREEHQMIDLGSRASQMADALIKEAKDKRKKKNQENLERQIRQGYCDQVWPSKNNDIIKIGLITEENPLFVINEFKDKKRRYERQIQIRTSHGKQILTQRVIIGQRKDSTKTFGVLTQKHQESLYRLTDLWQRAGCKLASINGNRHAILDVSAYKLTKALCGNDSALGYANMRAIIEDLQTIPITIENAFTHTGISKIDEFTILNVEWHTKQNKKRTTSQARIQFASGVTDGFIYGRVKPISFKTYLGLRKNRKHRFSTAVLLYRILDDELATKDSYHITLQSLLKRLGMLPCEYKSQRKQRLISAFKDVDQSLILEDTHKVVLELSLSKDASQDDYVLKARRKKIESVSDEPVR